MIRIKFGNHKLGNDTGIFNMGTAKDCPAKKLGMCAVVNAGIVCYAEKAERQYKDAVIKYRELQERYWKDTDWWTIYTDIKSKIQGRKKPTRYIRFNESGDFYDQSDVYKLSEVAKRLKEDGIVTYGYTARRDLDFSEADFLVKGSCHEAGNNGTCITIKHGQNPPDGFIKCPGGKQGCARCNLCKIDRKHNIAFEEH